jgi:hypothetical protein
VTFLNAWAAGFAAIGPVIVLLYLLKLKRRALPVSTLIFWQRVLQENRRRAFFQRLRQLFSLLLHLLIFALILGALLRPTVDRFVRDGSSTVLIIDTRARMQAAEPDGRTRFAIAREHALALARQASAQRQIAIIDTNAAPTVIAPFTGDEKVLRESVRALAATDATGDIHAAVHLAGELLAARKGEHRIVVLTDRAETESGKSEVTVIPAGTARDNVAITRLATRPLPNSPQTSEVLMEVANFGRAAVRGNVELSFDGRVLDVKPFALEAGARSVQIFPTVPRPSRNARGWLAARLDTPDALAADNVAYAVLPVEAPRRVLLVSKGNWFLEKLLAADTGIAFELLAPDSYTAEVAEKFDAVILDGFLPPGFDLANARGNFLFIKQTPFSDGGAAIEQPLISETDALHPAMRMVNLQNVTFIRAASLTAPKLTGWSWQSPIRAFDHPLMITGERRAAPRQRVAALALDVTDSDLPLRVAFPLLISNTTRWLAGEHAAVTQAVRAGETLTLGESETITVSPEFPSAQAAPPKTAGGFFQPLRNGYYAIAAPDGPRWLAVNTFSDAESDLRFPDAPAAPVVTLPALLLARVTGWPLWRYLALSAFALFALEWWLFHRRRTE